MDGRSPLDSALPHPNVRELTPAEVDRQAHAHPDTVLLDVRDEREWEAGHIPGAVLLPRATLERSIGALVPDRGRPIVAYCAIGIQSLAAARTLAALGYTDVASMSGGYLAWLETRAGSNGEAGLRDDQVARYSRHLLLPEIGPDGQRRLLASKVLIVGAGGLGSAAAPYLAAAGIGTIGVADFDTVELSNLQRQVIHRTDRVGQPKTRSARDTILALNPDVNVVLHEMRLDASNVAGTIAGYDVIVDGTDNFDTRYVLNDAAVAAGLPVVHASVFRFEGQLTVFQPGRGPCYRCLHPVPPPSELAADCSVAGVLGVVPGVMGVLQALETIKLLVGIGEPLVGRLLVFDALDSSFEEIRLSRNPACPTCGEAAARRG